MKLKNKSDLKSNVYSPIVHKKIILKPSRCRKSIFLMLTIILLVAALLCLHLKDNKNNSSNIQITKYRNEEQIVTYNSAFNRYCSVISDDYKFDCFPRGKADQNSCEERNCCWSPSTANSQVPWCYYPSNYTNYKVINVTKSRNEIVAFFNLTSKTNYINDVKILCMNIIFQTAQRLRIKVINNYFGIIYKYV